MRSQVVIWTVLVPDLHDRRSSRITPGHYINSVAIFLAEQAHVSGHSPRDSDPVAYQETIGQRPGPHANYLNYFESGLA